MPIEQDGDLKVYKPTITKENPLPLEKDSLVYNEKFNKAMSDEGEIAVQLDDEVVMQRIAKDLYSSYLSGLRELYNNEARACRQAKEMGADPIIEITIDPVERQLTIHGIDSLGITGDMFLKVMRKLGVSGNLTGKEVGQFGFGFASYTTLSDLCIVETWSRETDECYAVMGKNGIKFNMLPKPELETYGTKITMTYKEDVEAPKLIENLIQYAKFSRAKTELIVINDLDVGKYSRNENWTAFANAGRYQLPQYETIKDYIDTVVSVDEDLEEENTGKILWRTNIHENNDEYEFFGTIYAIQNKWDEGSVQGARTYETVLVGTPIQSDVKFNGFTAYVLNIKDERKFMPTADRDRLTDKATEQIQETVNDMIAEKIKEYKLENINDYLKTKMKELYSSQRTFEWDERTTEIINLLETQIQITRTGKAMPMRQACKGYKQMVYMPKFETKIMAKILTEYPKALIFKVPDITGRTLASMENIGILDGRTLAKTLEMK